MSDSWRCHHCGEVIGVYEPVIRLIDGRACETSRASEPPTTDRPDGVYHRVCFERVNDDQSAVG